MDGGGTSTPHVICLWGAFHGWKHSKNVGRPGDHPNFPPNHKSRYWRFLLPPKKEKMCCATNSSNCKSPFLPQSSLGILFCRILSFHHLMIKKNWRLKVVTFFQTASQFQPFEFPRIQIHHDIIIQIHCMQTSENNGRKNTGMTKTWQGWHILGSGWYVHPNTPRGCIKIFYKLYFLRTYQISDTFYDVLFR